MDACNAMQENKADTSKKGELNRLNTEARHRKNGRRMASPCSATRHVTW